jgi:hypothetical protein
MASGHVYRANRPNTWLHRPMLHSCKPLANPEPSTHGPSRQFTQRINSGTIGGTADMPRSLVAGPGDANDPGCVKTPCFM